MSPLIGFPTIGTSYVEYTYRPANRTRDDLFGSSLKMKVPFGRDHNDNADAPSQGMLSKSSSIGSSMPWYYNIVCNLSISKGAIMSILLGE